MKYISLFSSASDETKPEDHEEGTDIKEENTQRASMTEQSKQNEDGAAMNHDPLPFGRRSRRADISGSRTCVIL